MLTLIHSRGLTFIEGRVYNPCLVNMYRGLWRFDRPNLVNPPTAGGLRRLVNTICGEKQQDQEKMASEHPCREKVPVGPIEFQQAEIWLHWALAGDRSTLNPDELIVIKRKFVPL